MRATLSFVAALWLAALPAAGAGTAETDWRIAAAEERLSAIESGLAALSSDGGESACRSGFNLETLLPSLAGAQSPLGLDAEEIKSGLQWDALRHFEYRAYAARDASLCAPMASLRFPATRDLALRGDYECLVNYHELVNAASLTSGSRSFVKDCAAAMLGRPEWPGLSRREAEASCAAARRWRRDPEKACSRLTRFFEAPELCRPWIAAVNGDAAGCANARAAVFRDRCLGIAAYAHARRSRDATACGGSELCRVLMGQGATLAREASDHAAGIYCGKYARLTPELAARYLQAHRVASELLEAASKGPSGATPAFRALARRRDDLGRRLAANMR